MKYEVIISRIISAITGDKVAVRENLFYDSFKGAVDFTDDDLVNKRYVDSIVPGGGVAPVPSIITAGVTPTPLVVAYNATTSPIYSLKRPDNSFDWNTTVQYDGADFTINGADDGSGKFADSYIFTIKP